MHISTHINTLFCGKLQSWKKESSFFPAQVPILLARYAGQPDSMQRVEEAIRTQQNNTDAVKYGLTAAKILERVLLVSRELRAGRDLKVLAVGGGLCFHQQSRCLDS